MQTLHNQLAPFLMIQRITLPSLPRFANAQPSVNASIQIMSKPFERFRTELSVIYLLLHFAFTYTKDKLSVNR